ncbi:carbon monoxide dehydrogenase subunit G [Caballeronia fortuita]|uniref:Carbon monoxide dehydrogenase subunit G n=1 Tax=Caballeronia fortuita TaxID=1777138 RepID=A0A157ZIV9_9BURK|nr:SRPBCC domain-containing protein [Caballeronia fortuita]SAK45450.1 carbon monoxide dehydrogenase subunit G [Caballeronia fortuita]
MEVTDALCVPLDPAHVREALSDLTLLRASLDNCESFTCTPAGEYVLTLIVPLGALRARYEIRAHAAGRTRQAAHVPPDDTESADTVYARTLSFKARGEGVGSLRGQIAVALNPDDDGAATWIEYTVWATVSGPLAGLPARQIENALREGADDFFAEFCEVVRAKHGLPSMRAAGEGAARRHVFLRPGAMSAAMSVAFSRRPGARSADAHASGVLRHRLHGHGFVHRERDHSHDPHPLGLPVWAWAAMLVCIALFAYFAQHVGT